MKCVNFCREILFSMLVVVSSKHISCAVLSCRHACLFCRVFSIVYLKRQNPTATLFFVYNQIRILEPKMSIGFTLVFFFSNRKLRRSLSNII